MKFYIDVKTPHFVNISEFRFPNDYFNLKNSIDVIQKFESLLIEYLKEMQLRETVISKILDSGIGFPLEIDTFNYNKFSLYFHYNKNNMSLVANSSLKGKSSNQIFAQSVSHVNNLLIHFKFIREDKKLEFQIINCDLLRMLTKKKIEYGTSEKEINSVLQIILQTISEILQPLKK
jgi:hypothetical protein